MFYLLVGSGLCLMALLVLFGLRKHPAPHEPDQPLEQLLAEGGFAYDAGQDLFFARRDAWQRKFGYCRAYGEAAAPLGMYLDCEPVYFTYGGKRWLIELWKGQYGLCTGAEVGIYTAPLSKLPDQLVLFQSARPHEELPLSLVLLKGTRTLFERKATHWWLTGFRLGEFSEPDELTAQITLRLKDREMCRAFSEALTALGYTNEDLQIGRRRVRLAFTRTHTPQPSSKERELSLMMQRRNHRLCALYRTITADFDYAPGQLAYLRGQHAGLYREAVRFGRPRSLYHIAGAHISEEVRA